MEDQHEGDGSTSVANPPSDRDCGHHDINPRSRLETLLTRILGSTENVGLLYMAISAAGLGVMGTFVKFAGQAGLSTWEIVLGRSLVVNSGCLIQLARARVSPFGNR